jgi:DNA-binding LacI/PurR family transcriptional regulator
VARVAGVSHQTVSRVLNDSPKVREETRARVLEAIESLGYRRNAAARALATNRTQVVGVLMLTAGEPRFGPTSTLLAVVEAARESGHMAMLAVARESSDVVVSEMLEHFIDQAVEGVIVVSPQAEAVAAARTLSTSVPVIVVASGEQPRPNFQVASVDQQLGAVLATRHLLELGHRDVVHISGPLEWLDAVQRVRGWRAERARWGLPDAEPITGDWTPQAGYEIGRHLLTRAATGRSEDALPTAIFAANDQLALGLLRSFSQAGVDVPGRVSVVGFDDIEGSDCFNPPLTTVRQPFADLGRMCMDLLLEQIGDSSGVQHLGRSSEEVRIPPMLLVRGSTAPPASQPGGTSGRRRGQSA